MRYVPAVSFFEKADQIFSDLTADKLHYFVLGIIRLSDGVSIA